MRDAAKKVLLATDNPALADRVTNALQGRGYEVLPIHDAVDLADVRVVIVSWPRLVATALTSIPMLALVPSDTPEAANEALEGGAADFLAMPFNPDELVLRVRRLARRHAPAPVAGPQLRIYLFDPLEVQVGGRTVIDAEFARRKSKALFVYLFLHRGRRISKYQLLADLWPTVEQADPDRVKHTVQVLRSVLEGERPAHGWHFILEQSGFYAFNAAAERYSDVEEFEAQLKLARRSREEGDTEQARTQYGRAVELRRGPVLADFRYDDWAAAEIARLDELYVQVLEELADIEAARGGYARAVELLRQAIAEDQLHERSYVELMRVLWLDGRRTEALRVYNRLRDVLARTLGVKPQGHATRMYEAIRSDHATAV
jgi:DNA-binding SARP family transcriptional activator